MLLKSDQRNVKRNYGSNFQVMSVKDKLFPFPLPVSMLLLKIIPVLSHIRPCWQSQYPRDGCKIKKFLICNTASLLAQNHLLWILHKKETELLFCLSQCSIDLKAFGLLNLINMVILICLLCCTKLAR